MSEENAVEELAERIRARQLREADEHAYGPASDQYPYDPATAGLGADPYGEAVLAGQARIGNEQDRGLAAKEHGAFARGVMKDKGPVLGSVALGAMVPGYQGAKWAAQNLPGGEYIDQASRATTGFPLAGPQTTAPGMDQLAAGLEPVVDAAGNLVQHGRQALGLTREQRPTTSLEFLADVADLPRQFLLPRPGDATPQERPVLRAAGEALDAPFAAVGQFAKTAFAPIRQLLVGAGVAEETIQQVEGVISSVAEMAVPGGALTASTKGGSAIQGLGQAAYAVERGVVKGGRAAGRGLVRANELLGEAGAAGKRVPFVKAHGLEDRMVARHNTAAGATFNPRTGEDMAGVKEYAVGILSDLPGRQMRVPGNQVTREQIAQFVTQNADVLDNPSTRVGSWFNEKANETVFDIVVTTKDRATAKILAKKYDQEGIFDLSVVDPVTGKATREGYIPTGGTGGTATTALEHYSRQAGLTEIDPEMFGTGQAGRERARAADPEFKKRSYFYKAGAEPEARFKGLNKYTAHVPTEKILDIASPTGQALAAEAGNNPTRFERLLRQKGYLGYTDSAGHLPDAVAVFEPQAVVDPRKTEMTARTRVRNVAGTEGRVAQIRAEYGREAIGRFEMQRAAENQPWWYDTPKIKAKYGEDYEPFLDFIAVTSANRNVLVNIDSAEKVHKWWVAAGRPKGDAAKALDVDRLARSVKITGAEAQRVIWALTGDNVKITKNDVKLANFRRALRGDEDAVVLDLWMGRAYGLNPKRFSDPTTYETIADIVRQEAAEIGLTPRQYQERVWVGLKYLTEREMPPALQDLVMATPAERKRLLKNLDENPGPDARHAVYLLGSLILGDAAMGGGEAEAGVVTTPGAAAPEATLNFTQTLGDAIRSGAADLGKALSEEKPTPRGKKLHQPVRDPNAMTWPWLKKEN